MTATTTAVKTSFNNNFMKNILFALATIARHRPAQQLHKSH
jgi:hypothetical protein